MQTPEKTFHLNTSFVGLRSPDGKLMKRCRSIPPAPYVHYPQQYQQQQPDQSDFRFQRWVSLSWISAILALVFLTLTSLYASNSKYLSNLSILGNSPSNTILTLRVLSELAGVSLAAAIAGAFEKLQFILVSRYHNTTGFRFTNYLALEAGTGMSGLFAILGNIGVKHMSTRLWSLLRIVAIILVPILNVLIMSEVETKKLFRAAHLDEVKMGFGIGTFNASLAGIWAPMTDLLFATRFSEFLLDTSRAIEIPNSDNAAACTLTFEGSKDHICEQSYYVPGGIENFASWLLSDNGTDKADAFMAIDQQGFVFDFIHGDENWTFDHEKECKTWGVDIGAFALCMRNTPEGLLQTKLVLCDGLRASGSACIDSKDQWLSEPGWKTTLRVSLRRANVAYSRLNGTILSHEFSTEHPTIQDTVIASDVLDAFNTVFSPIDENSTYYLMLSFLGIADNVPVLPLYAWWWFHGLNSIAKDDPAAESRAIGGLQSLLALPIYHCQAKDFAELITLGFDNETQVGSSIMAMFPPAERDTLIYPALLSYDIVVDRATLLAYVALGGAALAFCFAMLLWALLTSTEREVGYLSLYPTLNFQTKCEVWEKVGERVRKEEMVRTGNMRPANLMRRVGDMRVRLAAVSPYARGARGGGGGGARGGGGGQEVVMVETEA